MTNQAQNSIPTIEKSMSNLTVFTAKGVTYWFSYETLVAFHVQGEGLPSVIQNQWGTTTAKHLNSIDGGHKPSRLTPEEFATALARIEG